MNHPVEIKLELGIDARKFIQQVQIYNDEIEKQVEQGVNAALEVVLKEGGLIKLIEQETISELKKIVREVTVPWELRNKIRKSIEESIGNKITNYSEQLASKITENLK